MSTKITLISTNYIYYLKGGVVDRTVNFDDRFLSKLRYDENKPSMKKINIITNELIFEQWIKNRTTHRMSGPAIIFYDDRSPKWYMEGYSLPLSTWLNINNELTNIEKIIMRLKYV